MQKIVSETQLSEMLNDFVLPEKQMRHKLLAVCAESRRALCINCGLVSVQVKQQGGKNSKENWRCARNLTTLTPPKKTVTDAELLELSNAFVRNAETTHITRHKLLAVSVSSKRGICERCGLVSLHHKKQGAADNPMRVWRCSRGVNRFNRKPGKRYRYLKKDMCEECGFVSEHPCQMDVHHIDENHKNNAPENLKTLCANCHRLAHRKLLAHIYY